jgi:hypothetical protein
MEPSIPRRGRAEAVLMVAASGALIVTLAFVPACSNTPKTTTPSTSASGSHPSTSATSAAVTVPATGDKEALGKDNPSEGDCSTNVSEATNPVGFVVLYVTPGSFKAKIQLRGGSPNTTYGVFMQQVPGSCPQDAANGGTLRTGSTGRGDAVATVPRVHGATTFFVQLVPVRSGPAQYTSDRISGVS